jgi:hypothetical protein
MRNNLHDEPMQLTSNVDLRSIISALERFIAGQSGFAWREVLREIAVITGNPSLTDDAGEEQELPPGFRVNGQRDGLLPLPTVEATVGLKKSTIYKMIKDKEFPEAVKI